MKLDRRNQPKTYTQMRISTSVLREQQQRAEMLGFIAQLCFAFAGLIFVAALIG